MSTTYLYVGHSGGVNSVAFSEDGSYVASGGLDKLVMIWKSNLHMLHMDCDGNETALPSEDDYGMSMNTSGDCVGSPGCEWVPTDSERGQSTLPQSSSQLEQSDILKKSMSMESESTLTLKMNAILAQVKHRSWHHNEIYSSTSVYNNFVCNIPVFCFVVLFYFALLCVLDSYQC